MSDPDLPLGTAALADAPETLPAVPDASPQCPRCAFLEASAKRGGGKSLTPERIATFLKVLRETGSPAKAASAATPWAQGKNGGLNTFRDHRRRDAEFSEAWDEAMSHTVGEAEALVVEWIHNPPMRPVYVKGEKVDEYEDRFTSVKLLLAFLARHKPDEWAQRRQVTVDGAVTHDHAHRLDPRAITGIYSDDIDLLPEPLRPAFLDALAIIVAAREAMPAPEQKLLPAGGES
jgi:hypothetical protein